MYKVGNSRPPSGCARLVNIYPSVGAVITEEQKRFHPVGAPSGVRGLRYLPSLNSYGKAPRAYDELGQYPKGLYGAP